MDLIKRSINFPPHQFSLVEREAIKDGRDFGNMARRLIKEALERRGVKCKPDVSVGGTKGAIRRPTHSSTGSGR